MKKLFDFLNNDTDYEDHDREAKFDNDASIIDGEESDTKTLNLRKEELDIDKKVVRTGDVEIGKEIIEEPKIVDVPVAHEEVIIERKSIDNERSDSPITNEETIHIPVSKEEIDVDKYTVLTGEVTARKRKVEETRHVEETLKREEAKVHSNGDATIIDNNHGDFR
ncbi:MAG: YsnF/AvaK domain-containing protein [Clostridiaceae bacterium]